MGTFRHIKPGELSEERRDAILVDVREPDEVILGSIDGAINLPLSKGFDDCEELAADKKIIVYCKTGVRGDEAAEILAAKGFEVASLDGGYEEYKKYMDEVRANTPPVFVDAKGLKCPGPIVKVADYLRDKPNGERIEVEATEDAFYSDIRIWCDRTGNKLDDISFEDGVIKAMITKAEKVSETQSAERPHDKTFVVFSGDLDKTIAAFIIANGAAAMGRKVTMFFTFWGLNILRRPEKVNVAKTFIEKMFGMMMPRGTYKLGLSRMNMLGAGPRMIRGIMKKKGIISLEDLIESAKEHGVRLVACQMSMDIMGIHREELIDGIELGGVSTFLGSGEESDMSLFI